MSEFAAIAASIQALLAAVQLTREIAKKGNKPALGEALAKIQNEASKIALDAAQLRTELARLEDENREIRQQRDLRNKLVFRDGLYHLSESVPGLSEGPFCPTCWENRGTLITLLRREAWCEICHICFRPQPFVRHDSTDDPMGM